MKELQSLVQTHFNSVCKNGELLQSYIRGNKLVVNNFLSISQDVDGDLAFEYTKNGDTYIEMTENKTELVKKVVGLTIEHIAQQPQEKKTHKTMLVHQKTS